MEFPINEVIESFLDTLGISFDDIKFEGNLASMSNSNYLFGTDIAHKKLVVRVDNDSNSQIINREVEEINSQLLESLGIGPRVCFSKGYKISEYITSPTIYDKSDKRHLPALCKSLASLHGSDRVFWNLFDPIKMAQDYLAGLKNPEDMADIVSAEIEFIRRAIHESVTDRDIPVPCQVDLVPENLIYSEYDGKMYIIDQEYSGNFYPEWDLADLASETAMTPEEEAELLICYQHETHRVINLRLYWVCKALCNLLWSAWALYYEENEGNMSSYFNLRYGNYIVARDYYKEMFKSHE